VIDGAGTHHDSGGEIELQRQGIEGASTKTRPKI